MGDWAGLRRGGWSVLGLGFEGSRVEGFEGFRAAGGL